MKVKAFVLVAVVALALSLVGCGGSASSSASASGSTSASASAEQAIVLKADQVGEYGVAMAINAGKDTEKKFIAYSVPAGTYAVTNNAKAPQQVTVYADGIEIVDGHEEQVMGASKPVVIKSGESADITVGDGEYISMGSIGSSQYDLSLVKK